MNDGQITNDSRWLSTSGPGPHVLTLTFPAPKRIACIQMVSGWFDGGVWKDAVPNFGFEYRIGGNDWKPLPGTARADNDAIVVTLKLPAPVEADAVRLVATGPGTARVAEIRVFGPAPDYPIPHLPVEGIASPVPPLLVNQSGYSAEAPRRFTAPTVADGTPFTVRLASGGDSLFQGTIRGHIGDFTAFKPSVPDSEYVIAAGDLRSDPFRIAPLWLERVSLEPALRFMVDDRSVIGTHPSAFGGSPWRDGTYYSYEVPSLVMLYLAAPAFFDNAPSEIHWDGDKARVLAPEFKLVPASGDKGAMEAARSYFTELDAPVGNTVPDIVRLIHWGIGWHLVKPESADPSGDPVGRRIHPQMVEQFAFFLYGFPQYKQYFSEAFYRRANDFAFAQWEKSGLLDVITTVGDFKGRNAPGHSILPNLLMYEVARREKRPDADRYKNAAVREAAWLVTNVDAADPRMTKGQRMSEHMTITGLTTLLRDYPDAAPAGLKVWLTKWSDTVIARSDNLWDFRRYDDTEWSLPRFSGGSHGGEGWNEAGNIAGFPACALSVAYLLPDATKATRLRQIATAHFDDLFGRNPLGAHAGRNGAKDYAGVERGWPKAFPDNVCARLERVRGTLNATASTEQYPNNPKGAFRHAEGWTAFNSAFNVSLAYAAWDATRLTVTPTAQGVTVELTAPFSGVGYEPPATVNVSVADSRGDTQSVTLRRVPGQDTIMRGMFLPAGKTATVSYGYGIFARRATATLSVPSGKETAH